MTSDSRTHYLRNEKYLKLRQSLKLNQKYNQLTIEEYNDATILPIRYGEEGSLDLGGVITKEGNYVLSSKIPGWATNMYSINCQCKYVNKVAVYCGRMIGHWGHFLLETITRLWFFIEYDDPSFIYILIVKEGSSPPIIGNFRRFFELLGINDRIIFLNKPIQYQKVIVPDRSFQYKCFFSKFYSLILDNVIQNSLRCCKIENLSKKIFLSRSKFERAQQVEIGLDMLDDYFYRNGYQIIYPEIMPLDELIVRIQYANECAAESGTIAHNFLFCRFKQLNIVLERQTVINEAQISIDLVRNLQTIYVDSHLTIVPKYLGPSGPFFLYYTSHFKNLTKDFCHNMPNELYNSYSYIKKNLEKYEHIYRNEQKGATNIYKNDIENQFLKPLKEAYIDTYNILNEYGLRTTLLD